MSLRPCDTYSVRPETARVARAIFPDGNLVMRLHDELGLLRHDRDFADLFPVQGQPAEAPLRLALVALLQFMEGLTDRQAADAVRTRIDWKYLLCLELTDPGFDLSMLSEFRTRLLAYGAERRLFDAILAYACGHGYVKAGGRQRSDSAHALGAMHILSRIEVVGETLRYTLNVLATMAPDWLRTYIPTEWTERYAERPSEYRLPKGETKRIAWAEQIGADGMALLTALYTGAASSHLHTLPAVARLRQVWVQNFMLSDERPVWRDNDNAPPSGRYIGSPYDPDARYTPKRETRWIGCKVHLTETCDEERPKLITNVETTTAAVADDAITEQIHAHLAKLDFVRFGEP
jgi:transposase